MKTDNAFKPFAKRNRAFVLIGVFMFVSAVIAAPFYSVSSSSLSRKVSTLDKPTSSNLLTANTSTGRLHSMLEPSSLSSPFAEGIATFAADCTTPMTDFNLGDTVCAKASGVQPSLFPWRITWVGPGGFVRQSDPASLDDSTTYTYTLPTTPTSNINDQIVDNRGVWRVNLTRPNGAVRQTALIIVHEPANPVADVYVQKFLHSDSPSVPSGNNISFAILVSSNGPDPASMVHLIDSVPAGGTLVQFTQNSGPTCVPAGPDNDCTIATLAVGDRAEFTAVYNTGSAAPGDYSTSATVSSTTPDNNSDNNTATAQFTITTASGPSSCQLICPDNINAIANTTEDSQRGAHVTFDDAVTSGDCGVLTAMPSSGSFFPVGQTVVTVTSEMGGGSCSFTVTVTDNGTNPPTIACPASQQGDADNNCQASFNLGNPTTSGDNVTVTVSRSDGQPMYDCDQNGQNCVRKTTDLPFNAGVTTVTWTAYSHDTPGPYVSADDEISHRTGSASCNQTITVVDVTPPTIMAPNTSASADANCQAPVPDYSTLATVSDNCACASSDNSQTCQTRQNISITQDPAPGTMEGLGSHTITLSANDGSSNNGGAGNTTTIQVTFTVNDTTPPTFTFVPPTVVAYTGPGATTCDTVISNATLGTATATDNCSAVTITRSPSGNTFPVGNTTVVWTATDAAGNHSSANQTVTVIDNTPPTITTNGQTPSMWPPDHSLRTFQVTDFVTSVFDNCGGVGVGDVVIDHVTSDELDDATGGGDGNTVNDIQIAANCKSVQLRSERAGSGDGRVYTITFRLRDTHGNVSYATATVVVPHDQGHGPEAVIDSGVHYSVSGGCP